jgi:hypothetical protein
VMSWYWLAVPGEFLCVSLGYWLGGMADRRLMRRINAQPWCPPMGTKPPTIAQLSRPVRDAGFVRGGHVG